MAITITSPAPPVLQSDTFEIQRQKINNLAAAFISTASQSLTTTGYSTFPNGLILQWGYLFLTGGTGTVVFPIAFPTAVLNIQVTPETSDGKRSVGVASSPTKTQFVAYKGEGNSGSLQAGYIYWSAIGY